MKIENRNWKKEKRKKACAGPKPWPLGPSPAASSPIPSFGPISFPSSAVWPMPLLTLTCGARSSALQPRPRARIRHCLVGPSRQAHPLPINQLARRSYRTPVNPESVATTRSWELHGGKGYKTKPRAPLRPSHFFLLSITGGGAEGERRNCEPPWLPSSGSNCVIA